MHTHIISSGGHSCKTRDTCENQEAVARPQHMSLQEELQVSPANSSSLASVCSLMAEFLHLFTSKVCTCKSNPNIAAKCCRMLPLHPGQLDGRRSGHTQATILIVTATISTFAKFWLSIVCSFMCTSTTSYNWSGG